MNVVITTAPGINGSASNDATEVIEAANQASGSFVGGTGGEGSGEESPSSSMLHVVSHAVINNSTGTVQFCDPITGNVTSSSATATSVVSSADSIASNGGCTTTVVTMAPSMVNNANTTATIMSNGTIVTNSGASAGDVVNAVDDVLSDAGGVGAASDSSESDHFDDSELLPSSVVATDEVTAQLVAAGPVGLAAAAAIATGRKRKRPHSFEINPSIRKRQQTRLLRKLKATIDEYTTRVGQQAVVLIVVPGKPHNNFKVFGAHPLESVVRTCRSLILQELDTALAQQAPPSVHAAALNAINPHHDQPALFDLPPLVIDGIPTPVEKMTQAQLRAFIPLMLKFSTGRGKPGWGRESTRPPWWPQDLPWANVRSDVRTEEDKQRVSWTHALQQIVLNCYRYHGREDLLPAFTDDADNNNQTNMDNGEDGDLSKVTIRQIAAGQVKLHSAGGGGNLNSNAGAGQPTLIQLTADALSNATLYSATGGGLYGQTTMVQAINNADGTVSIIQVEPGSTVVTLPDGTQAQVRTVSAIQPGSASSEAVQAALAEAAGVAVEGGNGASDMNGVSTAANEAAVAALAEAALAQGGQIILTGEDGTQSAFPVSGMVTIPVSMYHGMQVMPVVTTTDGSSGTTVQISTASGETVQIGAPATPEAGAEEVSVLSAAAAASSSNTVQVQTSA